MGFYFIGMLSGVRLMRTSSNLSGRVVPNFLVQTGDRTGTGSGGESFYGGSYNIICSSCLIRSPTEPFDDETHPRLRFTHRGLVGMANNGEKNSNTSQFFITLGIPGLMLKWTFR